MGASCSVMFVPHPNGTAPLYSLSSHFARLVDLVRNPGKFHSEARSGRGPTPKRQAPSCPQREMASAPSGRILVWATKAASKSPSNGAISCSNTSACPCKARSIRWRIAPDNKRPAPPHRRHTKPPRTGSTKAGRSGGHGRPHTTHAPRSKPYPKHSSNRKPATTSKARGEARRAV